MFEISYLHYVDRILKMESLFEHTGQKPFPPPKLRGAAICCVKRIPFKNLVLTFLRYQSLTGLNSVFVQKVLDGTHKLQ